MRLQVALAHAGCASRRKCAEIIKQGAVKVNGKSITEPGFKIDLSKDRVTYRGKDIKLQKKIYILLNKPKGYITTSIDTHNRKTVLDLIPKYPERLYHAGRLDKDTSGLLLITNDGALSFALTHPKFEIKRVYEVIIKGKLSDKDSSRLEKGIYIGGRRTAPCAIRILKRNINKTLLRITLSEGRKRQIRYMFEKVAHQVLALKRISFGPLELGNLRPGTYKKMTSEEITKLKKILIM